MPNKMQFWINTGGLVRIRGQIMTYGHTYLNFDTTRPTFPIIHSSSVYICISIFVFFIELHASFIVTGGPCMYQ